MANELKNMGYIVELHPRTFRIIYINGNPVVVSKNNDYLVEVENFKLNNNVVD